MKNWFRQLDEIVRGRATSLQALKGGQIDISIRELFPTLLQLGAVYGFCMGWFAILNHDDPQYMQIWASMVKVPLLFISTLVITLPSLYVFNALIGSRLSFHSLLALLLASMAIMLSVLASFGPIVAFFSLTTTSYSFMKLFNVLVFTVAGVLGLLCHGQTLHRLTVAQQLATGQLEEGERHLIPQAGEPSVEERQLVETDSDLPLVTSSAHSSPQEKGPIDRIESHALDKHVKKVFYCWVIVFALVGSQMSWVLRPFIGAPGTPFEWFRHRQSSFLEAVWQALVHFLRGD